ncbi:MAG: NAD-dependent epimerase/dehydratase family protein [Muribaculaceae bacterium]
MGTSNNSRNVASMLLTGASGFVGRHIMPLLSHRYAVTSLGRSAVNDIVADLTVCPPQLPQRYDVVLHVCGKAHVVPRTEAERQQFYDVNHTGTVNLCRALEVVGVPEVLVYLSTVAVYGCDAGEEIDETHPLGGTTPYAHSKILAEQYLQQWSKSHGVRLAIVRAPLMLGDGAPGNLGAMELGIARNRFALIGGGKARKSVLRVERLAEIVPRVAAIGGIYNVCEAEHPTFAAIAREVAERQGKHSVPCVPLWAAKALALCGDAMQLLAGREMPITSARLAKMTSHLTFSSQKARRDGVI